MDMLEDRYYMRAAPFAPRRSATLYLVALNVAVFLVQTALARLAPSLQSPRLEYLYLDLSMDGLASGYIWQLVTYQFLHAGLLHMVLNCLGIYFIGMEVEMALGRRKYLALYFSSGIAGGMMQVLAGVVSSSFAGPVVGASAAAFGLVAAFAVLFPNRVLLLFMIIPMRAKFLLLGSAILALVGLLSPQSGGFGSPRIADAAHLGGMLTGFVYVRYALNWNWRWPRLRSRKSDVHRLLRVSSSPSAVWPRPDPDREELPPEEFLSREVDPILDKISEHGIQSLTSRERRILESAREKMAKR
jgi:membrane associated rhomboid family serine protease